MKPQQPYPNQLTKFDIGFLQQVQTTAKHNLDNPEQAQALQVSTGHLSKTLMDIFGVKSNQSGAWFFNVYVEFVPMFKMIDAEDWQK